MSDDFITYFPGQRVIALLTGEYGTVESMNPEGAVEVRFDDNTFAWLAQSELRPF
jgi:hypothetical protein